MCILRILASTSYEHESSFIRFGVRTQNATPVPKGAMTTLPRRPASGDSSTKKGREPSESAGDAAAIRARHYTAILPPAPKDWPHRPVLVCANTDAHPDLQVSGHGAGPLPIGKPFPFSSDLFEGTCLIRLRDVPSDNPAADAAYFQGRKRCFQVIIQGRFREVLKVSEVLTGHEFSRPLRALPPAVLLRTASAFIRRLAPGSDIKLQERRPSAMAVLAATTQILSADAPGSEPDITCLQIEENASLLLGATMGEGGVPPARRKRHLANPARAARYSFDTDTVYTFDFFQHILDAATYSLDLGFVRLGIDRFLDHQPIQALAKTTDGRYLWSFQVWHETLIPEDAGSKGKDGEDERLNAKGT